MPHRMTFTRAAIAAITVPPAGTRTIRYDTKVPKLAVRVTHAGTRSFYVVKHVRRQVEWVFLGTFPDMTIEQARRGAARVLGQFADGKNPAQTRREANAEIEFGEGFNLYWSRHIEARGIKRPDDVRALWERCLGELPDAPRKKHGRGRSKHPAGVNWQHRKLSQVARDDAAKLHSAIGKTHPTLANRVVELGSAICNRLQQWGFDVPNPFAGIEPFGEHKRDRFLQAAELPRFFAALAEDASDDFRDFVTLALLTGGRRNNVLEMRWSDVNLDGAVWRIPGSQSKNDEPIDIPLVAEAVVILARRKASNPRAEFAFTAESKSRHMTPPKKRWAQLFDRIELRELTRRIIATGAQFEWRNDGSESLERALIRAQAQANALKVDTRGARIDDLRLHDLRRSLGSWQAILGSSLLIVGRSLGHRSPSASAVYARLTLDPVRASVERATSAMLVAGGVKQGADVTPAGVRSKRRRV